MIQCCESQLEISCHLGGNDRDAGPSVQKSKVGIFGEVSDMVVNAECSRIRRNLFIPNDLLNRAVKNVLLSMLMT